MLKAIQKEVENLRIKVYSGLSTEDTDTALYEIEQMLFKAMDKQLTSTDVVKPLEVFEEIVFEDWLKQHRFTKDINHYIKNNITYREWEVFNMYTMDVYNL